MRGRLLAGLFVVLGAMGPASAQNLVANGGFDTDIASGWVGFGSGSAGDGSRSWDPSDAQGGTGSAGFVLSPAAPAGTVIGLSQCIDISGQPSGSTYGFFSAVNGPLVAQSDESRAIVEVGFFSDTACTGALHIAEGLGATASAVPMASPPWQTVPGGASAGGSEGTATAPPAATGLQVRIYLERVSGSGAQRIFFDSVVVHRMGTTPVSLMHFAAE